MNITRAVETITKAVSPESKIGSSSGSAVRVRCL
jgi:hypothetical protein